MKRAALVLNPAKVGDADGVTRLLADRCADAGWAPPLVLKTTPEDPGVGMARTAVTEGVDVVVAAGGDGTVRAVAEGLVGSGVPLAVLPSGTGNLLARNLELPGDVEAAIEAGLHGPRRAIDVGRMSGSPDPAGEPDATGPVFVVMAGIGFDAAMMRDAPERLKSAVGWPAYLVGAARNLRRRPTRIRLSLDSSPAQEYSVRAVLVGNVGRLQAGAELLPDAVPDDGVLDVCLVAPRSAVDWLVLAVRTLLHRPVQDRRMTRLRATRIEVRTQQPLPRQLDGDVIEAGTSLSVHVQPGALLICCAPVREDAPAISDNRTTEAPR